jgi:hypothetical protein
MPLIPLLLLLLVAYVVRQVVAEGREGRRTLRGPDPEVARLREEVDELGAHVRRLAEEHAFMLSLLSAGEQPPKLAAGSEKTEPNEIRNPETPDGDA